MMRFCGFCDPAPPPPPQLKIFFIVKQTIVKISTLHTFLYAFVNSISDTSKYLQHEVLFMGERTIRHVNFFEDSVDIYMIYGKNMANMGNPHLLKSLGSAAKI